MFRKLAMGLLVFALTGVGSASRSAVVRAAELSASDLLLDPGAAGSIVVSGVMDAEAALRVTILVQLVPRAGSLGTVEFTPSPASDIVQVGDPWPGVGVFSAFDTDPQPAGTGSPDLNGSVDDNGALVDDLVTFTGALTDFPVVASADAAGAWDVLLSTSSGDSTWESEAGPVVTVLNAGTILVAPTLSLTVESFFMPPGRTTNLMVSGFVQDEALVGVTIMVELTPRAGATGTLSFTPSPPVDVTQIGDPWPSLGTFTPFDTDAQPEGTGSVLMNGSVDDNGSFIADPANPLNFSGNLSSFPVVASADAAGVWDVTLTTSLGASAWNRLDAPPTVLLDGMITVAPSACLDDIDCDDANDCTTEVCNTNVCEFTNVPGACDDGDACTVDDTCLAGACQSGAPVDCLGAGDQCNSASCDSGGAEGNCAILTPFVDGTVCDDFAACDIGESCQMGLCTGSIPVDCSGADDQCNVVSCDAGGAEGNCDIVTPVADGTPCDDFDACNLFESCQAGVCAGGLSPDCSAFGDQCNTASCDPGGMDGNCDIVAPAADGTGCVDADPCNVGETCQLGVCTGGGPVDCSGAAAECEEASCDPAGAEGNCDVVVVLPDGSGCDDGLFCTATDVCTGGICAGSGDRCPTSLCDEALDTCVDCFTSTDCDDTNPCTDDLCLGRTCFYYDNTAACEDGNACTLADTCSAGTCVSGSAVDCSGAGDQCNTASCDPGAVPGNCDILTPVLDLTPCDDGIPCTAGDNCFGGICTGAPVDCSGLDDACLVGTCVPSTGICQAEPANEGGLCDDLLSCTVDDICVEGVCEGVLPGVPTVDLALTPGDQTVQVGQTIQVNLVASSGTCLDPAVGSIDVVLNWDSTVLFLLGHTDTGPFTWSSSGFPDDSGLDGLNDPFTGTPGNDGTALYAAFADFQNGVTITAAGLVVTTFEFLATSGASGAPITIAVSGGAFSQTRVVGAGPDIGVDLTGVLSSATVQIDECQVDADCDDLNLCTTEVCNAGICGFTNNSLPCDDGAFCTASDVCTGGLCVGSTDPCLAPLLCSETLNACVDCLTDGDCVDGNGCTDDICNAIGTCENPNNTAPCDDGLFCTATDVCGDGTCTGSGDACVGQVCDEAGSRCVECLLDSECDDGNGCTDDFCVANVCDYPPNTLSCDDGLFCTAVDVCSGGLCTGGGDPCTPPLLCSEAFNACVVCLDDADCDDGNLCTTDVCFFGSCSNSDNALPCDDDSFCTAVDTCSGGMCVGSGDTCPGELCDETNNVCVECFTAADCLDTVSCTIDECTAGVCSNTPDDTFCDDGLFCTGAEFCSGLVGCVTPGNPCDDPALCDEAADLCGCQEPVVVAEGSRYLAVTPRPGQTPVALVLTGVGPDVSCILHYVQGDGLLGDTPVFKSPDGPGGWGTVHLRDTNIRPDTTYIVQTECETGGGLDFSTPATGTTWQWADVNDSQDRVNIVDITFVLDFFRGISRGRTIYNVDLWGVTPTTCTPNVQIDILDITNVVEAFRGFPFPCEAPCPP